MCRPLLLSLVLLTLIALPFSAAAQPDPATARFGTGIALLNPRAENVFAGKLSPDGNYVVGTAVFNNRVPPEKHLYVWDLTGVAVDGPARAPEPAASRLFGELQQGDSISFDSNHLAISPDSTTAAAAFDTVIYLLDIHDLTTRETYTLPSDLPDLWVTLDWSADGSLLAAVFHEWGGASMVVIEPDTGAYYRFDGSQGGDMALRPFKDGWLLYADELFILCTARLESCTEYPLAGLTYSEVRFLVYDPVHDALISSSERRAVSTLAWTGPDFASLTPDAELYAYLDGFGLPVSFSPSGRYYTVFWWGTGYYPGWSLWDVEHHKLLRDVGIIRGPQWLGVDDYFLHGSGQALGHPTRAEWIDELPDIFTIPFLTGDSEITHIALYQTYHEVVGVAGVSDDGARYLLRLGSVALGSAGFIRVKRLAYFTAPRDSPAMIIRWPISTSTSTGTTINTLSALNISQGRV